MLQAESLDEVDTEYSACSISACPNDRSIVACGLYQIVQDASAGANADAPATTRLGRCLLSRMDEMGRFHELHRIESPAILDMAWSSEQSSNRLAVADARGQISLYILQDNQLRRDRILQVADENTLCLSLDWSNRLSADPGAIAASFSDGSIVVVNPNSGTVSNRWHAHDFEPWIAAWDYWDTQSVWTGGDDCKLKAWDLRQVERPNAVNKNFKAGVTTIQSHPLRENLFAVGSYDAKVRLFDKRIIRNPLYEHDVGGGVWRVRWHPTDPTQLLTACMHDGFKVLRVDPEIAKCETVTRFEQHGKDALAYGVDWCLPSSGISGRGDLIASCSFYDHQMRSWIGG